MYILLEYVTYIALIIFGSTLLFGTTALFVIVRQGMRRLVDFVRASIVSHGPAIPLTTHVAVEEGVE